MTTFAEQLAFTFLGDGYESDEVANALAWAEDEITGYCGRTFDKVEDHVVVVNPGTYQALLPYFPVLSVTLVEGYMPTNAGGMGWIELTNYWYESDTGLIFDTSGLPGAVFSGGVLSWPWLPGSLRVTYTHGYDPVPRGLVSVACRLATQYLENPELAVMKRVGDIERRFSGASGAVISAQDQNVLDRYSIASVA